MSDKEKSDFFLRKADQLEAKAKEYEAKGDNNEANACYQLAIDCAEAVELVFNNDFNSDELVERLKKYGI